MNQALRAALAQQGFSEGGAPPTLALTYYWGILRVDHRQLHVPYEIRTNLRARIELVSTRHEGAEMENSILTREKGGGIDLSASSPRFLTAPLDSVIEHARLPRIFVVIRPYDYQELSQNHQARLIWSVKLSTQETSGEMSEVIPPLIAKGAEFFGKDLSEVKVTKASLENRELAVTNANDASGSQGPWIDPQVLQDLIRPERARISGAGPADDHG